MEPIEIEPIEIEPIEIEPIGMEPIGMDARFIEIEAAAVREGFPRFYDPQGRFFEILHKGRPIGLAGVRSLGRDCELEAFVFQEERQALCKGIVLAVLALPASLGCRRCWMKSCRKTVVKTLNSMRKYGIMPVGFIQDQHVFVREFP